MTLAELAIASCKNTLFPTASPGPRRYKRAVERYIKPALGRNRITDLSRTHVVSSITGIAITPTSQQVIGGVFQVMNLAEAWGF